MKKHLNHHCNRCLYGLDGCYGLFGCTIKTLDWEQAQNIAKTMPEVILFKDEAEMLKVFLQLIDDADILSGWNSEGYDIPTQSTYYKSIR